jgi:hypothetical protein
MVDRKRSLINGHASGLLIGSDCMAMVYIQAIYPDQSGFGLDGTEPVTVVFMRQ